VELLCLCESMSLFDQGGTLMSSLVGALSDSVSAC
jgi:hypothetical protein